MTTLELAKRWGLTEFYCETDEKIIIGHSHRSRKNNITIQEESFERINKCYMESWEKYRSYISFSYATITEVRFNFDGVHFLVHFTKEDWIREIKYLFSIDKRNFNWYIKIKEETIYVNP